MKILGLARIVLLLAVVDQRYIQHTVMGASIGNEIDQIFMEDTLDYDTGNLPDYQDRVKRNSFENELEPEVENIVVDGVEEDNIEAVENTVDYANEEVDMCITDQTNTTDLGTCLSDFIEIAGWCYFFSYYVFTQDQCRDLCEMELEGALAILGQYGELTDADPLMSYMHKHRYDNGYWVAARDYYSNTTYYWSNAQELSLHSYLWDDWSRNMLGAGGCVMIYQDPDSLRPALKPASCDEYWSCICEKSPTK